MTGKKVKCVMVGDSSVGKTCICKRMLTGEFTEDTSATIGGANAIIKVETEKGEVQLVMWDTAGQEQYRSLAPIYINGAGLVFFVYDITNRTSFEGLRAWYDMVCTRVATGARLVVVGNKLDLESQRVVDMGEADAYRMEIGAEFYMETSAKTGRQISDLFERAAEIPDLHFDDPNETLVNISEPEQEESKQASGCC